MRSSASGFRLVGAHALDVARLLALVADTLAAGASRAVTRQVTDLTAVVALLALGAVTAHVAEAAARVAGLAATVAATKAAAAVATAEATTEATLVAVASDVADLAALVALLAGSAAKATRTGSSIRALAREVVSGTAAVASLVLLRLRAVTGDVSRLATVVACRVALGWAVACLVGVVTTVVAATVTGGEVHCCEWCAE